MIKGMTGYAERQKKIGSWIISAEIWSYNHKFLKLELNIPDGIRKHSQEIEGKIQDKIKRGKVTFKISFLDVKGKNKKKVFYNKELAKEIFDISKRESKKEENFLSMREILLMPEVLKIEDDSPEFDKIWFHIDRLTSGAINGLLKIKKIQGQNAVKSLKECSRDIYNSLNKIKKIHNKDKTDFSKLLKDKAKKLSSQTIEKNIIQEETVNFIRNCEIEEEISRINAYVNLLKKYLVSKNPVGRKIDFVGQELLRETNTIGAKKDNFDIKEEIVKMKEAVEKIREHSHNVE